MSLDVQRSFPQTDDVVGGRIFGKIKLVRWIAVSVALC
jgi:hypothetical protein